MVNTSPIFGFQYLFANQSQKEIFVNQNYVTIDAFLQPTVISITLAIPPASPSDGDKYIVPTGSIGVWSAQTNNIALYSAVNLSWIFFTPKAGWWCYNQVDGVIYIYTGTTWAPFNARGTVTLNASATTTTVTNAVCTSTKVVLLSPSTPDAANDMATTSVVPGAGSFVITHANNARVDRTFKYVII